MKHVSILLATLLAFSAPAFAASPSSALAKAGKNPSGYSTIYEAISEEGVEWDGGTVEGDWTRDNGQHEGWCKGQGHLDGHPGTQGSGHRNHWSCENPS